jgi:hypothetical protein
MNSHFRLIQPFIRSKDAEVVSEVVGERVSNESIERDASVLEPADDAVKM